MKVKALYNNINAGGGNLASPVQKVLWIHFRNLVSQGAASNYSNQTYEETCHVHNQRQE